MAFRVDLSDDSNEVISGTRVVRARQESPKIDGAETIYIFVTATPRGTFSVFVARLCSTTS